jgi:hypothetical protein
MATKSEVTQAVQSEVLAVLPTLVKKARKTPPSIAERMKTQLSAGALRAKISIPEIEMLEGHLAKIKALLS